MEGFPQNKRESGVMRIIGVGDKEERKTPGVGPEEEKMMEFFKGVFEGHGQRVLEKEKSQELSELIVGINRALKEFLGKYGMNALDIPAENIHIVDWDKLSEKQTQTLEEKRKEALAWYIPNEQGIVLLLNYKEGGKLSFTQTLVHEMLHANSFQSYQVARPEDKEGVIELRRKSEEGGEEEIRLRSRRVGFSIWKNGEDRYFNDIDEAIIQELAMRFERGYFAQLPELEEEYAKKQRVIAHISGEEDEVKRKGERIAYVRTEQQESGRWEATIKGYSYPKERESLNKLIDDLYEKNRDEFSSREGVFDMFARAVMTGKLLPVGDLITKTYGLGSFRELGEKTIKSKNK